ncbi:MAG: carboxypeptidase-like regulatory domain-containing protein [Bacteroidales bacterium]|nr:carboxypeptidase-like regulatory domain-containing protein [Bacteroidales bacterium]
MKLKFTSLLLLLLFIVPAFCFGSTISGKITGSDSLVLSFSTVYVKNSTYGVTADFNGNYFIELKQGKYTLVYNYLGYKTLEKEIVVGSNQKLVVNVVLQKTDVQIPGIEVVANKADKAKKIMKHVRNNRRSFLTSVENFECTSYVKTSIENEFEEKKQDSTLKEKDFETYLKKENLNLIEYVAETYFKRPQKYKEVVLAYHDFTEEKPLDYGRSIVVGAEYGEMDIAANYYTYENPFVFYKNVASADFNFYQNQLDLPSLCNQPIVSPIASNSNLFYNYEFNTSFYENGVKINKIKVEPKNEVSALFYGNIYIEDSSWALLSVDLYINEQALLNYQKFNIIQNYQRFGDSIYLPVRTEIIYTIANGKDNIVLGNTKIIRKDYVINQEINNKIFNNEIITYQEDAMDKDSLFWGDNRPIALKENELEFIDKTDSIKSYYTSDEYLDEQDSLFNRLTWWTPLVGFGRKNHYNGTQWYVGGLLEQVNPFGIGGYRHKLPVDIQKRFSNDMIAEIKFQIDYGFKNKDVKGKFGFGLTYFPKKFVRTYVEIGDYYDVINNYASFEQIFSRSNYVRNKTFAIKQRMEIVNGLYAELGFLYSNQIPINNLQLSNWSDFLFGELNEPIDFEQYIKTEVQLDLKYVPAQKYIIKGNRKIIIGSDLPEITFTYRKGIPNLFNSEVNFDYVELGSKGIFTLARFGESRWQLKVGKFLNTSNLRLLEYKYFRGSDQLFFSSPVTSMQLLPSIFSTNSEFLQANYVHHFNGSLLNKVPLFKYLKLSIAFGGASLLIPNEDFYHYEMFAGLEKVFRIKTELFRFGIYAVTADNNLSNADFSVKIGLSNFSSYKKKWDY